MKHLCLIALSMASVLTFGDDSLCRYAKKEVTHQELTIPGCATVICKHAVVCDTEVHVAFCKPKGAHCDFEDARDCWTKTKNLAEDAETE